MPRRSRFPKIKHRYFRGGWELYWYWDGKRYTYATGLLDDKFGDLAEAEALRLGAVLAAEEPQLSPKWKEAPGIRRYMAARYGAGWDGDEDAEPPAPPAELLEQYRQHLTGTCTKLWTANSMGVIKCLDAFAAGGFLRTTGKTAEEFMQSRIDQGLSIATRNRNLAVCKKFFGWLTRVGAVKENPFKGIKSRKEKDIEQIVYCTEAERERILKTIRDTGRADWIAVAIAFYAGCRREETFRLNWEDVFLGNRRLIVRKPNHPE